METFRTPISIPKSKIKINYLSQIMFMGSCFSENIGNKLVETKFAIDNNPFGIVYNPISIKRTIVRLLDGCEYLKDELSNNEDLWCSFDHHGRFSDINQTVCLSSINQQFTKSKENLLKTNILFLTFGTAYVYYLKSTGQVVSNCHKFNAHIFDRKRITVNEIVDEYTTLIKRLKQANPNISIVFTVSPVRHWTDGAHENQISKSILLLAIDQLCGAFPQTFYFPSYEIMLDDLRDYRFYSDDMFHPNTLAISYIWQQFVECFIDSTTNDIMSEIQSIVSARNHRPFNAQSEQYKAFARKNLEKINRLQNQFDISFNDEKNYFMSFLE